MSVIKGGRSNQRRASVFLDPQQTVEPYDTLEVHTQLTTQQLINNEKKFGISNPSKNRWRFFSACLWSVVGGWNDGAPGCLLPYMELFYGLNYTKVSLIWIGAALGFVLVALTSHYINKYLSNRVIITVAAFLLTIMTLVVSSGTLFPVVVVGFFFGGIGSAMGLSQLNVILSNFENCPKYLGIFHGSYGLGLTISPLIATVLVTNGVRWNLFYLIAMGTMAFNCINIFYAFEGIDQDLDDFNLNNQSSEDGTSGRVKLALKNIRTWLISLFLFFYQGLEVAIGGFIVSYFIDYRDGVQSKIGYVASGYWGGVTIGRVVLVPLVVKYMGLKRGGLVTSVLLMVFIALTWLVPNMILESVFISIAGVFIGPTYPLLIQLSARILPRKIQIISLTVMSSFGSSGGAIFPFIVGLISDKFGTFVVLPVSLILYALAILCWVLLTNPDKKITHWWDRIW